MTLREQKAFKEARRIRREIEKQLPPAWVKAMHAHVKASLIFAVEDDKFRKACYGE